MTTATKERTWKRYWTPIGERRQRLEQLGRNLQVPQDFHILGAGITGLAAALEILNLPLPHGQRHSVTIYEGSGRIGGRINTKRLGSRPEEGQPDTRPYFERGAMRIPTTHDYTWAYAREGELNRRLFLNDDRRHDFLGRVYNRPDFVELTRQYRVRDPEVQQGPGPLFMKNVLEPEMALLDEAYGGQDNWGPLILRGHIQGRALSRIDERTVDQVLSERLRADPGQKAFLSDLLFAGLLDRSFLMLVRNWLTLEGDVYELCKEDRGAVVGGMDLLITETWRKIERLAPGCLRLKHKVTGIATDSRNNWRVQIEGQKDLHREGRRNRHLLCSLPYTILRDLKLEGFSERKTGAIRGLSMAHATKVALHVKERFWETDFQGGRALNDRLNRSSYFPNDHHKPEPIPPSEETHAHYNIYTQPAQTQSAENAALRVESAPSGPWLMLSSYTFGEHAEEMGKRNPLESVPDLERWFGKFEFDSEASETWYWNERPWAKGPFALPEPRNVSRFYQAAIRPERGVFFTGDHLSALPGWIQGSLYSSLEILEQVLTTATGGTIGGD